MYINRGMSVIFEMDFEGHTILNRLVLLKKKQITCVASATLT